MCSETVDAMIAVLAPENTRDGSELSPERQTLVSKAHEPIFPRMVSGDLAWVGCYYPTQASAQAAEMTLSEFEDFLYGACLVDWDAERERMQRLADRFDAADEVRIVGPETDLTLSLAGRHGKVDAGGANMPGGEFFFSPVEDSAEGEIAFVEYPASRGGVDVKGVRLRFESGRVVEASAETNEDFLLTMLDTDEGARRSASSGSAATPGSSGTCGTRSSTRRSTAPSISRSAAASRSSAAATRARSTGTSSRTCAAAASCTWTARSSSATGAG